MLTFFIPMCFPPEIMVIRKLADFAKESDEEYEAKEA